METLYIISFICTILALGVLFVLQNQASEFEKTLKPQLAVNKIKEPSSYMGNGK